MCNPLKVEMIFQEYLFFLCSRSDSVSFLSLSGQLNRNLTGHATSTVLYRLLFKLKQLRASFHLKGSQMSFLNSTEDGNRLTVSEEMNKLDYKKTKEVMFADINMFGSTQSRVNLPAHQNLHFNLLCVL